MTYDYEYEEIEEKIARKLKGEFWNICTQYDIEFLDVIPYRKTEVTPIHQQIHDIVKNYLGVSITFNKTEREKILKILNELGIQSHAIDKI
jgi:hypothetical protein